MNKMPIYAAAATLLLSTTAMAQTTVPPAMPNTPAATTPMTPGATSGHSAFIQQQRADQHLASNLIGMKVHGAADENLGEINDLVLDRTGAVTAAVIGVGGFLGVGQKDVAVPFQAVEVTRNADGKNRLVLRKTKDELKAAPEFAKYDAAPSTTGSVAKPAHPVTTPPATTR
ncbi:PRC-barrel domain-containing protein [Xanthobacter oligotrophicus]|uniref:PRC-barrel domain-containing protein n=1 Tax=Xanthobacter oligotrophicus TaxID=2607286 RepID=UPI0011F18A01|nr:PRC-barrel domain-containing protein [Xanthobacter oligotrophicus]MCG5234957.1 PRC-barrel domain-containing protein [Xanthobacter oligotrophicus]